MLGGESSSVGIVFYDTSKTGTENAVFCSFSDGSPVIETGEKNTLLKKMHSLDKSFCHKKSDPIYKIFFAFFIFAVLLIAAVWVFIGGFFPVAGSIIFAVGAFFPSLVILYSMHRVYPDEEVFQQMRRFHGAEHMMVSFCAGKKNLAPPDTIRKKASVLYGECGMVHSANVFLFFAALGTFFALIPEIGFFRFLLAVFISAAILFINIFNPLNPLKLFQLRMVKKPEEKEFFLAYLGMEKLYELN